MYWFSKIIANLSSLFSPLTSLDHLWRCYLTWIVSQSCDNKLRLTTICSCILCFSSVFLLNSMNAFFIIAWITDLSFYTCTSLFIKLSLISLRYCFFYETTTLLSTRLIILKFISSSFFSLIQFMILLRLFSWIYLLLRYMILNIAVALRRFLS
jgi:hypothetical protein